MISVRRLSKTYGAARVVDDVSFDLFPGTVTALLGGNGAGKSTLLKLMGGVLAPNSGEIRAGAEAAPLASIRDAMRLGVRSAHQEGSLIPAWTVREHFTSLPAGAAPPWAQLAPHIDPDATVGALPQRDQQLLEVCRAVYGRPQVILADEPTAGLEPELSARIVKALQSAAAAGAAVLWVTHDLEVALASVDRVLVLRGGRLVRDAPATDATVRSLLADFTGGPEGFDTVVARRPSGADPVGPCFTLAGVALPRGRVVGIVARSAAGVSTAMRRAAGLAPTARSDPLGFPGSRPKIGYMSRERSREWDFDGQDLLFNLTASIVAPLARHGLRDRPGERAAAEALVEAFSIVAPSLEAGVHELSGGNRQKVVLARLASSRPQIFLLDEPFSGVDAPTRRTLAEQLRSLAGEGAAVAIYSQELPDLIGAADRLVAIRDDGATIDIDDWSHPRAAVEEWLSGPAGGELAA